MLVSKHDSLIHALGSESMNQNTAISLRSLANKVLSHVSAVPQHQHTWNSAPPVDYLHLADFYHERAGIYQHDGGYTQLEAERFAYRDTMAEIAQQHFPELVAQFAVAIAFINTTTH